jgi:hypothetical protein
MNQYTVTIEDRLIFTTRVATFTCQTENEALEMAEPTLGRWERIKKVEETIAEELPDGT